MTATLLPNKPFNLNVKVVQLHDIQMSQNTQNLRQLHGLEYFSMASAQLNRIRNVTNEILIIEKTIPNDFNTITAKQCQN